MRKKTIDYLTGAIIKSFTILILISCSSDDKEKSEFDYTGWGINYIATEKGDNYEVSYQYNDDVVVLDKQLMKYLIKVENDSILYFSDSMPDSIRPHVGSIYSARVTELTPYGLGNVVLSQSSTEDGLVRCITRVAPIEKIFKVLDLKMSLSMADVLEQNGGVYDDEGVFYETRKISFDDLDWGVNPSEAKTRLKIGSPEVFVLPFKFKQDDIPLFCDLNLAVGGIITYVENKTLGTFENSLELFAGVNGRVGIEYGKDLKSEIKKGSDRNTILKNEFKNIKFASIPILKAVLSIGPVILRPFITADIWLKAEAAGTAAVGVSYKGSVKYGMNEKGKINENNFKTVPLENLFTSFELNGKVKAGPLLDIKSGIGLYTENLSVSIHPSLWFAVGGNLEFTYDMAGGKSKAAAGANATFDVEGSFGSSISASLFGYKWETNNSKLKDLTWNLFNLSIPILPELDRESFKIEPREGSSPLVFDAEYTVTGGIIARLMGGDMGLIVKESGKELYTVSSQGGILYPKPTNMHFELNGLKEGVVYEAIPCIILGQDCYYEWSGEKFSLKGKENKVPDLSGTWKCIEYADDGSIFEESKITLNQEGYALGQNVSGNAMFASSEDGSWRVDENELIYIRLDATYSQGWLVKSFTGTADNLSNPSKMEGTVIRSRASFAGRQWDDSYKFVMTK